MNVLLSVGNFEILVCKISRGGYLVMAKALLVIAELVRTRDQPVGGFSLGGAQAVTYLPIPLE